MQACGRGVQRLLQAAKGTRMKPTGAVTATDHGCGRARKIKPPTVEGASAVGPKMGCGEASVCEKERAGKQSRLTIFCDATGAGSSLYFRALSGACDSDMLILRARWRSKDAGKAGSERRPTRVRSRCSSAGLQFHAQQRPGSWLSSARAPRWP